MVTVARQEQESVKQVVRPTKSMQFFISVIALCELLINGYTDYSAITMKHVQT